MAWLHVRFGRTWLGLPAGEVASVLPRPELVPVPAAPPHLAGVALVDGVVHAVLDPVSAWDLGHDAHPARRLVLLVDDDPVGLLASDVRGLVADEEPVAFDEASGPSGLAARSEAVVRVGGELTWLLAPGALADWLEALGT